MTAKTRKRAETLTEKRLPSQLQRPGEYRDPTCPGFGLRVSPKLKAVWFVRVVQPAKGPDGKRAWKRERVGEPPPLGSSGDGVMWLTLSQAQAKAREMRAEAQLSPLQQTRLAVKRGATLRELLDEKGDPHRVLHFFRDRQVRGRKTPLAVSTVRFYREVYGAHLQAVADWPLVEFQDEVVQWKAVLERIAGASKSRALGAQSLLSAVYDYLMHLNVAERNPMTRVRRVWGVQAPPPRKSKVEVLDLRKFVRQLRCQRMRSRTAVEVGLLSGMRRTAFLGMRWEHLKLESGLLIVPPGTAGWKGWHGEFPLSGRVCALLDEWRPHAPKSEWVFPARHGPRKGIDHQRDLRSSLERACDGLGFVLPTHGLRRTFAALVNILYPGDVQLLAALLAHKWAFPEQPKTGVTTGYLSFHERLRMALDRVAQLYAEVLGEVPMSDATLHALAQGDVKFEALALPSHDESDDGDDWLEDKDEGELAA